MDVKTVRLAIARSFDEGGWTQEQFAARAQMRQSHISKIINVGDDPDELKDLAARVLFQIIEKGLQVPLSAFFAAIEHGTTIASGPPTQLQQGLPHDAVPAPSEEEYRAAIRILAAAAGREAERANAAHHRLPPGDGDPPSRKSRDRARRVRRAAATRKARSTGKRK